MSEIPMEHLRAAMKARLPCPVDFCKGTVKLRLTSAEPGDLLVWSCDLFEGVHEWHEDGRPRWSVVEAIEIVYGDQESGVPVASAPVCDCSCHTTPGVMHVAACCKPGDPCAVCGRKHPGPGTPGVCDR